MSCAAKTSVIESKRRPCPSNSSNKSANSSSKRRMDSPIKPPVVASERVSISPSVASTSTFALYSGLPSTMRHFILKARITLLSLAFAMRWALAAKMSSLVALQPTPPVMALTSMRLNLTMMMSSPSLMKPPSLFAFCFTSSSKSSSRAPLTRRNSSLVMFSHMASSSPDSLQLAQASAAALSSPILFTAQYSRGFMPLPMTSFLASSRHILRSPVQLAANFANCLLRPRFTMPLADSADNPAPSLIFSSAA
mmetsp:Transcript_121389/g.377773  ORF Transcript_121389/g.377773 Transcript_121389/m.377773 type:complete len:252 (+) Transcript_121389:765-1520(+)